MGFLATVMVAVGYVPQIHHLWKERCAAGISVRAWCCWVVASLLFYAHALSIRDPVFIALLSIQLASQVAIVVFATRYRGMLCEEHVAPLDTPMNAPRSTPNNTH